VMTFSSSSWSMVFPGMDVSGCANFQEANGE
jgi:hypothetical protein